MLTVNEAQSIVIESAENSRIVETETLNSLGGILAEDVLADRDLPPFDRAMMDGYAVISRDLATPATLALMPQVLAAGTWPEFTLESGSAVKVMTGAPLPPGADAVQKIEETRTNGSRVEFLKGVIAGENVDPRGAEIKQGDIAVPRGTKITSSVLGVIGSFGLQNVDVHPPPSVAVLTTGSEIVEFFESPGPSQIRNSNSLTLLGLLWRHGIEGRYMGRVKDDLQETATALKSALDCDLVLITGGASIGDFDFVEAALQKIGAQVLFNKVSVKPGRPVTFARLGEKAIFSLPGNPVSVAVTFLLFVDPFIKKCMGCNHVLPTTYYARLAVPFRKKGHRPFYVAGICTKSHAGIEVRPVPMRGSGDLVAFARANCLIIAPEGDVAWNAGQEVEVLPLEAPHG